jgi:gamma-glutamyl-gamma-aminobutyrate hydrolase PuuD
MMTRHVHDMIMSSAIEITFDAMTSDWDTSFGPAPMVKLSPGGLLWRLAGDRDEIEVNSLYSQAIDRLAPGL